MTRSQAASELPVLFDELKDAKKKLSSSGKAARPIILQCIKQIERDIQRNTAMLNNSN